MARRFTASGQKHAVCERLIYQSVTELADATVEGTRKHPQPLSSESLNRGDWIGYDGGFSGVAAAAEAAAKTWAKGLRIVEGMLAELDSADMPQPTSRRRKRRWSEDSGDDVCLDRMRSGQRFWRDTHRTHVKSSGTITVICDVRAAGGVSWDAALWRAVSAIVLTYLLERAGYRVELWAAQAEYMMFENADGFTACRIKRHGEPLDIGAAITGMSTWFYRAIMFRSANIVQSRVPTNYCGYDRKDGVKDFVTELTNDKQTFIVQNVFTKERSLEFIKQAAAAIESGELTACEWAYSPYDMDLSDR
jgi:hypothetical protein